MAPFMVPRGVKDQTMPEPRIAVLLPCYNEEAAIRSVVSRFRRVLPGATVYVYDNASSDRTGEEAAAAGALVRHEQRRGKGYVVRRMFADIEADIYVLADGDDTYDADSAPKMIALLVDQNLDMVVGTRMDSGARESGDPFPGARVHAGPHHHVQVLVHEQRDHLRRAVGVVGAVAVGQDVDIGLDVGEHAAHHVPLAAPLFVADKGAGGGGLFARTVAGGVVVDIDRRPGKHRAEPRNHRSDGGFFVVAGQQDGDFRLWHCLVFNPPGAP